MLTKKRFLIVDFSEDLGFALYQLRLFLGHDNTIFADEV